MKYLLETPHTKQECLREMNEVLAEGQDVLNKFYWGCNSGDHTGYAIVDAQSENEAKRFVPGFFRNKARAIGISQMTPEKIRSLH